MDFKDEYINKSEAILAVTRDGCTANVVGVLYHLPPAEVVPKSELPDDHHKQVACYTLGCREGDKIRREVAREIFEEIERLTFSFGYGVRSDHTVAHTRSIDDDLLKELKKKYTEG